MHSQANFLYSAEFMICVGDAFSIVQFVYDLFLLEAHFAVLEKFSKKI